MEVIGENRIQEISSKVFYDMKNYSQLIIDLVQEVEQLYIYDEVTYENCGALQYDINLVLEVIDPLKTYDIEILKSLSKLLKETFK
jgi:hypothetical protein